MDKTITGVSAITWKMLADIMKVFDVVEICQSRVQQDHPQVKRTMWPVILTSALVNQDALKMERKPLLTGHPYVLAWYLSMFKQLETGHESEVLRLLQCALTPTVQIRTNLSPAQRAQWSIERSNQTNDVQLLITYLWSAFIFKSI